MLPDSLKVCSNLSEFKNLVELYKTKKRVAKSQFKELAIDNGLSHRRIKYYGHLIVHALNDIGYKNLLIIQNKILSFNKL